MKSCFFVILFFVGSMKSLQAFDGIQAKLREESLDREQKVQPLLQAVAQGDMLVAQGEVSKACKELASVIQDMPENLRNTPAGLSALKRLSEWESQVATTEAKASHWQSAKEWALRSLGNDPNNLNAQSVWNDCQQMLGRGARDGEANNSALSDHFFDKLQTVNIELEEAEKLRETGQLREAEAKFESVLGIDPFNEKAMEGIQRVSKEKYLTGEKARDVSNLERKREVGEAWNNLYPKRSQDRTGTGASVQMKRSITQELEDKLKRISIPQIDFSGLDLETVRKALVSLSRQHDTYGKGVNFVISSEVVSAQPVTLKLRDVSLDEVIRYVAQIAGVKLRISEIGVTFAPIIEKSPQLIRREFSVSPAFFKARGDSAAGDSTTQGVRGANQGIDSVIAGGGGQNEQTRLEELGVKFPDGAFAVYNKGTSKLRVVNNAEMLDLIQQLIGAADEETLLIQVGVRLVEINQVDLDSITVNSSFGGSGVNLLSPIPTGLSTVQSGATPNPSTQQGVTAQLNQIQGVGMLPNNTLQSFLQPNVLAGTNQTSSYSLNTLQLGGSIMGGMQFRALLTAISQKSSANVLASPTLTLKRGFKGKIDVTQGFRYIKEYSDPQYSVRTFTPVSAVAGSVTLAPVPGPETVIGSFPVDKSDEVPIGVVLGVKPDISGDNSRVLLDLEPTFTDFEGFINYGTPIYSSYSSSYYSDPVVILTNNILQPVFIRRDLKLETVEVSDGYTLMLGGLLREDIQTVDEQVPIIGDIPIIGRAFQGKTEQAIKKNTLIFVTPRILQVDGRPLNPTAGLVTSTASAKSPP